MTGIKPFLIKCARRNYLTARWYHNRQLKRKLDHKPLIVVYQMGKVGSSSVQRSLWNAKLGMPVVKAHALSDEGIRGWENRYYGGHPGLLTGSKLPAAEHLFNSYYLRQRLPSRAQGGNWKIVTLVRDPVARNLSEFFHSVGTVWHQSYLPNFYERLSTGELSTESILQRFLQVYQEDSWEFQVSLNWFDCDFKTVTGIDVYASDFPGEQGYALYSSEGVDVLLLKLERLQSCASEAFPRFLGIEDFQLESENRADHKAYYPTYAHFVQQVTLPEAYLDSVYSSKHVRHFYSENEIDAFRRKWQKA